MYQFKLPDVGEGIYEAEIVQWLVNVGDTVAINQPILEIQTDKAVVEIPSPVAGRVAKINVKANTLARVGDDLITFATAQDSPISDNTAAVKQTALHPAATKTGIAGPGKRVLAAPAVRKMARERGIDLTRLSGSGPAGRVLPSDVRKAAQQPKQQQKATAAVVPLKIETKVETEADTVKPSISVTPPPPLLFAKNGELSEEEPLQGIHRQMAKRMEQAWHIPHVTVFEEIDAANLVALRQNLKPAAGQQNINLTYLPFIVKAVVQLLKKFPYFNASLNIEQQKILKHHFYHIGLATNTLVGLLVPVLRHANQLTVLQTAKEIDRLANMARQRKLTPEELSGSTFTITNFGSFGTYQGSPIINPPEVAILGCGKITKKPVAVQDQVEIHPVLPLALSFDHRLIDGAAAAQFMNHLKDLLAQPCLLLLEMA